MLTVALIGPDGAGKTTISRTLEDALDIPVRTIYMGVNLDSSGLMLPTTRLVHALRRSRGEESKQHDPPVSIDSSAQSAVERMTASIRAGLRLVNWVAEEWLRQSAAWYYKSRGSVVVFDRHFFFDYYLHDVSPGLDSRPLTRRIHGFLLDHIYPKPDLVICLDAPAEVLFARKPEGTLESVERRRREYLQMRQLFANFVLLDASQPLDEVAREVATTIRDAYEKKVQGRVTDHQDEQAQV
jgi:thymidylate kinase